MTKDKDVPWEVVIPDKAMYETIIFELLGRLKKLDANSINDATFRLSPWNSPTKNGDRLVKIDTPALNRVWTITSMMFQADV